MKYLFCLIIFLPLVVFGQVKVQIPDGREVILNEDFTWRYAYTEAPSRQDIDLSECEFDKDIIDEFTGDITKVLKTVPIGRYGTYRLTSSLARIGETIGVYLSFSGDLGCLTRDSYAIFRFVDGKTYEVKYILKIDCGTNLIFTAVVPEDLRRKMKETPVEKVRISYSDSYADIDIQDQNYFQKSISCLE